MSHVVEVRHIGVDREAATDELRRWLNDQGIEPMLIEHSTGGPGVTFRIHFTTERVAEGFAEAFHGWLNDGREPKDGALWGPQVTSPPPSRPKARVRSS